MSGNSVSIGGSGVTIGAVAVGDGATANGSVALQQGSAEAKLRDLSGHFVEMMRTGALTGEQCQELQDDIETISGDVKAIEAAKADPSAQADTGLLGRRLKRLGERVGSFCKGQAQPLSFAFGLIQAVGAIYGIAVPAPA